MTDEVADVAAAQQGDRAAFGRLHDRYAAMIHGLLLARLPAEEADDLTQDVFVNAMRKLPSLRDPEALGPWLVTMARRMAAGLHRRRRPLLRLTENTRASCAGPCHRAQHDLTAEAREALAAIRALPEAYRETLLMRLVAGLSGPEIAARTGLTPGSVRVNLHRGMTLLRARLDATAEPAP